MKGYEAIKKKQKQMKNRRNKAPRPPPPPIGRFPCLVHDHGIKNPNQTFLSLKQGAPPIDIYGPRISALKEKKVFSCSYGYLVLYDYKHKQLSLFNCTTFDTTPLPKLNLKHMNTIDGCVLSSSPKSPNCMVLAFLENCQIIMCCRIKNNGWTKIRYRNQLRKPLKLLGKEESIPYSSFCDPVICRGKIYANLRIFGKIYPELWSIEIVDKDEEVELLLSRLHLSRLKDEFMVESKGELYCFSVHLGKTGDILDVEMRKLCPGGMDWERVNSLENRSIFICQDYSVSCPTRGHDCVFFTTAKDRILYTYNLKDDSLPVSLPFGTSYRHIENHPFWMLPEVLTRQDDHFNQEQTVARLLDSEKEDDEEKTLLTDLPFDALNEVAKLLTPHEYLTFRSLSRVCRLAAPLTNWRKRRDFSSFPLHMFAVKCRSLYRFVHPLQNRAQSYLMTIPYRLKDAKVQYSNHGWLLMAGRRYGDMHFYMYNPFTKDIRDFFSPRGAAEVLFFTSKPSSSTCFLIAITCFAAYVTPASTPYRWTRHQLHHPMRISDNPSPVLLRKALYFLAKDGELARFYFEENNISLQDLSSIHGPCQTYHQNFLVECGGDLLSVFVGHKGKWIRVYKLDESELVWETVTSLKGYALYLSQASSVSEMASPGLDNRIYFPRFRDGGALYYAMDRAEWKFFGSEETLCDFSDTELQLRSCWIKPSWS